MHVQANNQLDACLIAQRNAGILVENLVRLAKQAQLRSCYSLLFDEALEISEVATERSGQHHRFYNRTNLHIHFCGTAEKRIEKEDADAEIIGISLPDDAPVRHAYNNLCLACDFPAVDDGRAGEARIIDSVDLGNGSEEAGKILET